VRDPKTGKGSRDPALYREVVERVRSSDTDVVINLTAGMGGDFEVRDDEPSKAGPATDMVGPLERLIHVEELLPEICTLDCGTLNFGDGNLIYISTPKYLREGAKRIRELGVKPELEVFDTGHLWFAKQMVKEGLLAEPPLFQICLGIPWGAPADTTSMKLRDCCPPTPLGRVRHQPHADADGGAGYPVAAPSASVSRTTLFLRRASSPATVFSGASGIIQAHGRAT
jgi:uncharacterized protein (DUF849 family)